MTNVLIIAEEGEGITELLSGLAQMGFACSIAGDREKAVKQLREQAPDLVLVVSGQPSKMRELCQRLKLERHPPIIALASKETLNSLDVELVDDFVLRPWNLPELAARIKRTLGRTNNAVSEEVVKYGDLLIDLARCEVFVGSRLIDLTFREYELLKFLVANGGRVYTRQALLNKVWGFDYYGGDRTVDVHVRRLRSKIGSYGHTFIETVRNIGYRLRKVG